MSGGLLSLFMTRIIYRATRQMSYDSLLYYSNITSLQDRRYQQAKRFFTSILDQSSCLHHLLPQQRDNVVTSRLRSAFKFPVPFARTNKFQSFINYGLIRYRQAWNNTVFVSQLKNSYDIMNCPVFALMLQTVNSLVSCLNIALLLSYSVLLPPV